MKIGVIGSGKWGTAVYNLIKKNGFDVCLISRNSLEILKNNVFDLAFIALRTEAIEGCINKYRQHLPKKICSLSKGVLSINEPFFSEKAKSLNLDFSIMFGPNFADELEDENFTISTISSTNLELAHQVNLLTKSSYFEPEITTNTLAVEIFGIFKNIIAIFMGFASKINMPQNTKSAILTKLIQEMIDLCKHLKQEREAFFLSAGIGDLFLTASSGKSRNFNFGFLFGENNNYSPEYTVEGLRSLKSLNYIEQNYNFKFNYYQKLYDVFINKADIKIYT